MSGLTNYSTDDDSALSFAAASGPAPSEPVADPNSDADVTLGPDSWRVEVAVRLERYRTRRKPRTPRYPSLLLPFDAPESWSRSAAPPGSAAVAPGQQWPAASGQWSENQSSESLTTDRCPPVATSFAESRQRSEQAPENVQEISAKVIEFPRSAAIPVSHASELADPIFDRPRIVEVPEILPPPPALGGMLIEPARQELTERRGDSAVMLPSASIARRALSALVDGAILAPFLAVFAGIFIYFNPSLYLNLGGYLNFVTNPSPNSSLILNLNAARGPLLVLASALGIVAILLWAAYEFLFVVYTGSTPGLRAARLRFTGFDGSPLNRRLRRWRVLASFLSAFSAGLGYLWCALDQHELCWHDRITRTYVRPAAQAE